MAHNQFGDVVICTCFQANDRRLADLTAEYFRQNGLTVAVEARGDRAVARFKTEQPRIVLLDLMLPGADGLTVCR